MKRASTATRTWKTCTTVSALVAFAAASFAADLGPRPPCGAAPVPLYSAIDAAPVIRIWDRAEWTPPPCIPWDRAPGSTLVASAARFQAPGGADALRHRIGAISTMKGLQYWSTTDSRWQPLIVDAAALEGPDGPRRRDFSLEETAPSRDLYFEQQDNRLGKAVYRLRILEATPGRVVFATENAAAVRYLGLVVAQPAEIRSITFLDRDSGDVWRYYTLARTGKAASLLTGGHEASLVNRAAAVFRHLAGIPADREPPAAR